MAMRIHGFDGSRAGLESSGLKNRLNSETEGVPFPLPPEDGSPRRKTDEQFCNSEKA
ncbi:MAG: hypothetical protein GY749_12660 [Desulfobacteraceae bacterium]|nr:hypothetical protein [Desulfobacteraceae bacterium]